MCCQLRHRPIFDRIEYLCARSLMDRARDFGSWGWGFDSLRARTLISNEKIHTNSSNCIHSA